MKALNKDSIVGESLEQVFHHTATVIAGASRDAVTADEVVLLPAPAHTGSDLSFQCFKLARQWKMNPAQIAQEMASSLVADNFLAGFEAAGPYLNIRLHREKVAALALEPLLRDGQDYGHSTRQAQEVVMLEYISPNTNKPLHLGHLRNAVLGRAVANLIASQGAKVYKSDIINDRGIHIAKSMIAYQRWAGGETPQSTGTKGDHFVGHLYVEFDKHLKKEKEQWLADQQIDLKSLDDKATKQTEERFNKESELLGAARALLQAWEAEDSDTRALWKRMNSWVYEGFNKTYQRLGIDFDKHYYESDIYQGGKEIIFNAEKKGLFIRAENGAIIAPLSQHSKLQDKVVIRADGTGLYITQDINLATIKFKEFGLTRSLYCIASEQDFYMKQLIATLKLLGFPWADSLIHLSYGMVYLPEGKMKSREGNVVDADQLMDEMSQLAAQAIEERYSDLDKDTIQARADAIGLAAMTFHFLIVGKDTATQFDPKSSLAFEGKTGPYLQYSYARVASILRKAENSWQPIGKPTFTEDIEWRLVFNLMLFPSVVADSTESYDPSRLASYLIELAQTFNAFYHDHPILRAEDPVRATRLTIAEAFKTVIGNGLRLMSIEALEEM